MINVILGSILNIGIAVHKWQIANLPPAESFQVWHFLIGDRSSLVLKQPCVRTASGKMKRKSIVLGMALKMKRNILHYFRDKRPLEMKRKSIVLGTGVKNEIQSSGRALALFWDERALRRLRLPPTAARGRWAQPSLHWFFHSFLQKEVTAGDNSAFFAYFSFSPFLHYCAK